MDHNAAVNKDLLFNIYYQLYLDDDSLGLLEQQSKRLYELSGSVDEWNRSPYGGVLKMCDSDTLAHIRQTWASYVPEGEDEAQKTKHRTKVNNRLEKARTLRDARIGGSVSATTIRASAPVVKEAIKDLRRLNGHFWEKDNSRPRINPSLVLATTSTTILHYGTDPLAGFHLSVAYAPLAGKSPLAPSTSASNPVKRLTEAAQLQFRAWAKAFKGRALTGNITIRFCFSDALAFCYTLQHLVNSKETCANWPRSSCMAETLSLDDKDYVNQAAPLRFNVIDTSNLFDHLGPLNVLTATAPLLERSTASTLYTELLVKRNRELQSGLDDLLGGHFPTIVILLGLFPVGYWANATAISDADELLLEGMSAASTTGQMFHRQVWKLQPSQGPEEKFSKNGAMPKLHFGDCQLALLLFRWYKRVFLCEDPGFILTSASDDPRLLFSVPRYNRPSFAAFLKYVKNRVDVPNWDEVIVTLTDAIENQASLNSCKLYLQEFQLYNHLYGVHSTEMLRQRRLPFGSPRSCNDFRAWTDIPSFACITVKVPRSKLRALTVKAADRVQNPVLNGFLVSSSGSRCLFGAIQTCFGTHVTVDSPDCDRYSLTVSQDSSGWGGKSDLFVSFRVPMWMLLQEPTTGSAGLCLQPSVRDADYSPLLGFELEVYKAEITNNDEVFITKGFPNDAGACPILCGGILDAATPANDTNSEAKYGIRMTADVNLETGRIQGFTAQIDLLVEETKRILKAGESVHLIQELPFSLSVLAGQKPLRYDIIFPAPVVGSKKEAQLLPRSATIKLTVPIAERLERYFPGFMFPVFLEKGIPMLWNVPLVGLDSLQVLELKNKAKLQWLNLHTSLMFSARESKMRGSQQALTTDARVNYKESIFSLFVQFSGLQGTRRCRAFALSDPRNGGMQILIFISSARLDSCNRTVILDVALIPLVGGLLSKIKPFLEELNSRMPLIHIVVNKEETKLWKQVLPSLVERCRKWEHGPDCEYATASRIPLSFDTGKQFLCSCGNGVFPDNFIPEIRDWHHIEQYAVRAAISPTFPVPLADKLVSMDDMQRESPIRSEEKSGSECWNCGKSKIDEGDMRVCSGCHEAKYCSRPCQRAHLKQHKKVCGKAGN
jgi:hypothetical protein